MRSEKTINVVIVDDSAAVRKLLSRLLEANEDIRVVGTAKDGLEALQVIQKERPHIATMDLLMPGMSGLEATREIMSSCPVPIIIVSADSGANAEPFKMLEAGAVAVVKKPPAPGHPEHELLTSSLLKSIRALAGIKLVRRQPLNKTIPPLPPAPEPASEDSVRCIAIGASTGGPPLIKQMVDALPADFPLPILLTQHMAAGFLGGFASWLAESNTVRIEIAKAGQVIRSGTMYLAPDDYHMGVDAGRVSLSDAVKEYGLRPSVAYMFRSVAREYRSHCMGILLTGMGRDGSLELGAIRQAGGITIAQDRDSSVVHGMPGVAIELGHAAHVMSADNIVQKLVSLAQMRVS